MPTKRGKHHFCPRSGLVFFMMIQVVEILSPRHILFIYSTDVKLLDEWYIRDDNALPGKYVLQPVSSKFSHFNSRLVQSGNC